MWSVVILSPTLSTTSPVKVSETGSAFGKGLMFGPRRISTSLFSGAGSSIKLSLIKNFSGKIISLIGSNSLGSVK